MTASTRIFAFVAVSRGDVRDRPRAQSSVPLSTTSATEK